MSPLESSAVRPMTLFLLANYLPDQQESMLRYTALLERLLAKTGRRVEVWRPRAVLGRGRSTAQGLGKWLGYLDKYVLFRLDLFRRLHHARREGPFLVHIGDHSNAMYIPWLGDAPSVVTCHDLLAVKSALGLVLQNRTGWSGRLLQRWILRGLGRAKFVSCDSAATRADLLKLHPHLADRSRVIELPLNYPYRVMDPAEIAGLLGPLDGGRLLTTGGATVPYLFHVGGNQWYKNREGVLRVFAELRRATPELAEGLRLVMAGKAPTGAMEQIVREERLDVTFLTEVGDAQLNALYSGARALVYPSLQEGYGWPILEAQAAGSPVITSDRAPMNEIGGPAALYADPADPAAFAAAVARVLREDAAASAARRREGLAHAAGFTSSAFLEKMLSVYDDAG